MTGNIFCLNVIIEIENSELQTCNVGRKIDNSVKFILEFLKI